MSLPDGGGLSSVYIVGPYADAADARRWQGLRDWEMGGIALNTPDLGLRVQEWTLEYYNDKFYLSAPSFEGRILLFEMSGVREISLAFDPNMTPFVAYMKEVGGDVKFESWYWWYDATVPGYVHVKLPDYSYYPKCCLDDKRPLTQEILQQHIILAYMREDKLYVRQQVDRFQTEKLQWEGFRARVNKIGMNIHNRLQFQLQALPAQ